MKTKKKVMNRINGRKCGYPKCKKDAEGYIRTKIVCREHFNLLKEDNLKRWNKGLDIPKNFELLEIKKEPFISLKRMKGGNLK